MASTSPPVIENLPYDVLHTIFSFLPVPDLAECAAVCRQWNEIVTGSGALWKGKTYNSDRSENGSVETCTVLCALPALQKINIQEADKFTVNFSYPCLLLFVRDISDLMAVLNSKRLTCDILSTTLPIVDSIFSFRTVINFGALRKLRISTEKPPYDELDTRAGYLVSSALEMCPGLVRLHVNACSLSAKYLDSQPAIAQLQMLDIINPGPGLKELAFLRHCSDTLQSLTLMACRWLLSAAYAELAYLRNLRLLRLSDCRVAGDDLEVAAKGLKSLESLHLDYCELLSDLSFLRHCCRLKVLHAKAIYGPLTGLRHLPPTVDSLRLFDDVVTAGELSEVLERAPLLTDLSLVCGELAHLAFLRHCPKLRFLCLESSRWPDASELSNLRHLPDLESLDLRGCRVDADVLRSAVLCPRLRELLLAYTVGIELLESEAYRQLCRLRNLKYLRVSELWSGIVRKAAQPCLPHVKIYSSEK